MEAQTWLLEPFLLMLPGFHLALLSSTGSAQRGMTSNSWRWRERETGGQSLFNLSITPLRQLSHQLFLLACVHTKKAPSVAFESAQVPLIKARRKS